MFSSFSPSAEAHRLVIHHRLSSRRFAYTRVDDVENGGSSAPRCSTKCVAAVHRWALSWPRPGFRVKAALGLKHLTVLLPRLLPCVPAAARPPALVDVGAGIHNLFGYELKAADLHEDDSDALWLLAGFGAAAHVHAFEANPARADELRAAAAARPATAPYARRLHVHSVGVGDGGARRTWVARCAAAQNVWGIASTHPRCSRGAQINQTTLDAHFARSPGRLLYVKIDVEGGEPAVIEGMSHLLRRGDVDVLSVEYAFGWNRAFESGAARATSEAVRRGATLEQFQAALDAVGYDTYLIHAEQADPHVPVKRPSTPVSITLVPVSGPFWRAEFELCLPENTRRVYGRVRPCWNDLLIIRRASSCAKSVLVRQITNTSHAFPECRAGCL